MGIQFENCYIASFPTMPMRADLFTGKYAFSRLGWAPLPLKETTLSDVIGGKEGIAAIKSSKTLVEAISKVKKVKARKSKK